MLWCSNAVAVVSWADGKTLARFERDPAWPSGVEVDPQGKRGVRFDSQGKLQFLLPDGTERESLIASTDELTLPWCTTFSPDGRWCCLGGAPGLAQVSATESGQVWQSFPQRVYAAAFSPDGQRLVVLSSTLEATLYNLPTRRVIRVLRGHEGTGRQSCLQPGRPPGRDRRLDGVVKLWSARPGREVFETGGMDLGRRL